MKNTLNTITRNVLIVAALALGAVTFVGVPSTSAVDTKASVTEGINAAGGTGTTGSTLTDLVKNIISVLLFIAGAVAVIMIILGGIRYITSNGDQAQVKGAKDTIMYSVIGLVVAILAYAIVRFVVSHL